MENRKPDLYSDYENYWYLELGGDRNTISDTEAIRDELIPLAVGFWDRIKNSGNYHAENWDLDFLGFLPGQRKAAAELCGAQSWLRPLCLFSAEEAALRRNRWERGLSAVSLFWI